VAAPLVTAPATAPRPVARGPAGPVSSGGGRDAWSGRPREFHSVGAWIGAATWRRFPAVVVAIALAWFNAPIVVIAGTIGAMVGGIAGLFSGSAFSEGVVARLSIWTDWIFPLPIGVDELLPTAAWQIGGIIGAAWGAFNGAFELGWLAFYYPWYLLYSGDPAWPLMLIVGQVLTALFCGTVFMLWSIVAEPARLRKAGARRMSRREAEWLMPIAAEVASRMRLAGLPRFLITDSREVNAYTATRHIVVHKGLLEYLGYDTDAVAGVIAHELAHWRYGDTVGMAFLKGVGLPLYLGYALALRVEDMNWFMRTMLGPLMWGVTVCVRYVLAPVEAVIGRRHEMRCDKMAARAGYGPGLRAALEVFGESFDGAADGWDATMLRSHPHTEIRLEALEADGEDYPLVEGGSAGRGPNAPAAARKPVSTLEEGW
jgi:Zn-dependent protease with chaperone function